MNRSAAVLLLLAVIGSFFEDDAIAEPLDQWNFDVIDSGIDSTDPSIRIDSQGYPHIAYVREDITTREISVIYARYTGSCWTYSPVESGMDFRICFLVLDADDNPGILYLTDLSDSYIISYATQGSGDSWNRDVIVSSMNSGYLDDLQIGPDGYPRAVYEDSDWSSPSGDKDHVYLYCDGSGWHEYELYDYCVGIFVGGVSMAVASDNTVHLSEYRGDEFVSHLYHGQGSGSTWQWETVLDECYGNDSDIDLSGAGYSRIAYISSNKLNFSTYNGSSWQHSLVDPLHTYIFDCAMATDGSGENHIAYYGSQSLLYAWGSGTSWNIMELDTAGWVGPDPDIALDSDGNPFIAYNDMDNDRLKLAWYGDPTGLGQQVAGSDRVFSITGISPNPASDVLGIQVSLTAVSMIEVAIFDMNGRLVLESSPVDCPGGRTELLEDISVLGTGVYLVRVSDGILTDAARVTILR